MSEDYDRAKCIICISMAFLGMGEMGWSRLQCLCRRRGDLLNIKSSIAPWMPFCYGLMLFFSLQFCLRGVSP